MKKRKGKIILFLMAVLLFVVMAILVKPGNGYKEELNKETAIEKTVIDKMDDFSKSKTVPDKKETKAEPAEVKNQKNSKEETANEKVVDYLNQHKGKGVHAIDKIDVDQSHPSKYPMVDADFSKVQKLNYRGIKKVYTYFRVKDEFPEVVLKHLNGAAVELTGAVMPVEQIPDDGVFPAFWLSNPVIVLAGCVFCNPPTMADIIYVSKKAGETPFTIEREKLFKQVVLVKVTGRFLFGPESTGDQTYLFSIEAETIEVLN